MIIRDILTVKDGDKIYSISPGQPVSEAVGAMVQNNIGSLVVKNDEGRMIGIFTERDVLRALDKMGCNLMQARVDELMTRQVIVGSPEDTVDYVRGVMTENHIRHLPVMEGNELLGVITFHDVAKACLSENNFEIQLLKRYIRHWPE